MHSGGDPTSLGRDIRSTGGRTEGALSDTKSGETGILELQSSTNSQAEFSSSFGVEGEWWQIQCDLVGSLANLPPTDVKRTLRTRSDGRTREMVKSGITGQSGSVSTSSRPVMPATLKASSTLTDVRYQRTETQALAYKLLALCQCAQCGQPINEPITLPCGHSSCLSCIVNATSGPSSSAVLPCTSHLPPRLPLSSTTVPCPIAGCPRSAIGKGMGLWSGHHAFYGVNVNDERVQLPISEEGGPGSAPVDGFVVPQNEESNRLVVIPAQSRKSYKEKYAISKYTLQSSLLAEGGGVLRPDVTLTKAGDLLRRYAKLSTGVSSPSSARRLMSRIHGRENASMRSSLSRRRRPLEKDDQASFDGGEGHHPAGTRTEINPHFHSVLGVSERGRDSGAMGGIRATWDSDDDEGGNSDADMDDGSDDRRFWNLRREESDDMEAEDDQDEEIGGAFARQYTPVADEVDMTERTSLDTKVMLTKRTLSKHDAANATQVLTLESLHSELMDVLECQLCYMLLYQPLTTPCGHTFCRQCFARSLDHSSTCPLCRTDMPSFAFFQEHPSNVTVMNLLTAEWKDKGDEEEGGKPDGIEAASMSEEKAVDKMQHLGLKSLYEERKTTMEKEDRESLLSTPLFVCTLAFPHMPTILHIFEPRYRLMVRRCLESGNPRFGMVLPSQEISGPVPGMSRFGTMLEIKTVQMLPDGRSMIETVGSHRFRVLERGSIDGYTAGQIERIDDVVGEEAEDQLERASFGIVDQNASPSVLAEAREAQAAFQAAIGIDLSRGEEQQQIVSSLSVTFTQLTSTQLVDVCTNFIETLRSGSAPWLMTRLNNTYGPMPDASSDVAAFGYWMALVMPIDENEKSKLLPIRSPRLRLRIVVHWIEKLRQTWWFNHGCSVQ